MGIFKFSIDIFISQIKIINKTLIGKELYMILNDADPFYVGINQLSKKGGLTIDFNKGYHLEMSMDRPSAPSKFPIVFLCNNFDQQYAGGINAMQLFNESISSKHSSTIAREHVKLRCGFEKEGAIVTFKFKINVEKVPPPQSARSRTYVSNRACDILQTNTRYREICKKLAQEVSILESKVEKMSNQPLIGETNARRRTTTQTQAAGSRKTVTFHTTSTSPQRNRTRPKFDLDFDEAEKRPKKKNQLNDSESDISSYYGGNSDNDINSDSDENLSLNSDYSMDSDLVDSDVAKDTKKKKKRKNLSSDSEIISDAIYSGSSTKSKKKKSSITESDVISDVSSYSSHKAKPKKTKKKQESSEEFESIASYSSHKAKPKKTKKKDSSVDDFDSASYSSKKKIISSSNSIKSESFEADSSDVPKAKSSDSFEDFNDDKKDKNQSSDVIEEIADSDSNSDPFK